MSWADIHSRQCGRCVRGAWQKSILKLTAIAAVGGIAVLPAQGDTFTWADPSGGSFHFASNWSPAGGPPDDDDIAAFSTEFGEISVLMNSDVTNQRLSVTASDVTLILFDLVDYTLTSPSSVGALSVGGVNHPTLTYRLAGDADVATVNLSNQDLIIAHFDSTPGNLRISGGTTSSALQLEDIGTVIVGREGNGEMSIGTGTSLNNQDTFIAALPGSSGTVHFNGTFQWENSGSFYVGGSTVGAGGTGVLNLNDGHLHVGGAMQVFSSGEVTIDGGSLEVMDDIAMVGGTLTVAGEDPATLTTALLHIRDNATVDFGHRNMDFSGSGPIEDLNFRSGTLRADVINLGSRNLSGDGVLDGDVISSGSISTAGITSSLTLGRLTSTTGVQISGELLIRESSSVTLRKAGFVNLGVVTSMSASAQLNAPNGVVVPGGSVVQGQGTINGRVVAQAGSVIEARTGDFLVGDPVSVAGFFSDGDLIVNDETVTLLDANEAVLGSLTTLGRSGATSITPGTLVADNGLLVEFGKNITGFGTIDTPNDAATPLTNNGSIAGHSDTEQITLNGYINGVGTMSNIIINGTLSPGFSPGVAHYSQHIAFGHQATLEIEIGGHSPGTEHDQLIFTNGTVTVDGSLNITLLNGFTPELGDTFDLFDFDEVTGQFDQILLPQLSHGMAFDTRSLLTTGQLSVIPEPGTVAMLAVGTLLVMTRRRSAGGPLWG